MLNKKILLSILIIGTVAVVAGAGTWAAFSDTEKSSGNTLTAGTMDLQLSADGTNFYQGISSALSIADVYPGATGAMTGAITVKNVGSVPGKLTWTTAVASNDENGLTDPEVKASDDATTGELGPYVTITYTADGTSVDPATGVTIAPGATVTIAANYLIADAGNNIQSDIATFDVDFTLTQNT